MLLMVCAQVIEMNQSKDQTKENNHRRNIVIDCQLREK